MINQSNLANNYDNNKYRDQAKLKILCQKVLYRIEELFDLLNVKVNHRSNSYYGVCPIHGGDNKTGFSIQDNPEGTGVWKCFTHHCEKTFMSSVIGFVRGVLSRNKHHWTQQGDKTFGFEDTIKFLLDFLKDDYDKLEINLEEINKDKFVNQINNVYNRPKITHKNVITRKNIRDSLIIPAEYYLKRGYSQEILNKYDVGLCVNSKKPMFNRVVVPIYDETHSFMVGCTGRSVFEKCKDCGKFHNPKEKCSEKYYPKWKHSYGFLGKEYLYNYWRAKTHIKSTGLAVLVESPGNVWRLEEAGIKNSVGLFGCSLSNGQRMILDGSGALSLLLILDNDGENGAGAKAKALEAAANSTSVGGLKVWYVCEV